jgi:hypothetical protein
MAMSPFDTLNTPKQASGETDRGVSPGRTTAPNQRPQRANPRHDPNRPISEMAPRQEYAGRGMHIPRSDWPDGTALQWVTETVLGKPFPEHTAKYLGRGWVPILRGEFDGKFDHFALEQRDGQAIARDGQILCARPKAWDAKARAEDKKAVDDAVRTRVDKHRGGLMGGTSLLAEGAQHETARGVNRLRRTVEPIDIGPRPPLEE